MELYGREDVPRVPEHVCNFRLQLLKERLEVLMSAHYMSRDNDIINHILKAQTFWKALRDGEENGD